MDISAVIKKIFCRKRIMSEGLLFGSYYNLVLLKKEKIKGIEFGEIEVKKEIHVGDDGKKYASVMTIRFPSDKLDYVKSILPLWVYYKAK